MNGEDGEGGCGQAPVDGEEPLGAAAVSSIQAVIPAARMTSQVSGRSVTVGLWWLAFRVQRLGEVTGCEAIRVDGVVDAGVCRSADGTGVFLFAVAGLLSLGWLVAGVRWLVRRRRFRRGMVAAPSG